MQGVVAVPASQLKMDQQVGALTAVRGELLTVQLIWRVNYNWIRPPHACYIRYSLDGRSIGTCATAAAMDRAVAIAVGRVVW